MRRRREAIRTKIYRLLVGVSLLFCMLLVSGCSPKKILLPF